MLVKLMQSLIFNWLDPVIVFVLIIFIWSIRRANPYSLVFMVLGFFSALVISGFILPKILPIHDSTIKAIVNGNLVLLTSLYAGLKSYDLGEYLKYKIKSSNLTLLTNYLSLGFNLLFSITVIWLVSTMIGRMPFEGLSNSFNDSLIVQSLDNVLPPVPAFFSFFDSKINPNDQPAIFFKKNNETQVYVPINSSELLKQANIAQKSVVRVTSFGCGGIVSGSGYVAGTDLVITNAHVIAGVRRPIIKFQNQSYAGTTVLFNPSLDVAAIRVKGLNARPLTLLNESAPINQVVAILGYPKGNYTVVQGQITDEQYVSGSNIYQTGNYKRQIYAINADLQAGNSGGPVINTKGQLVGIIFAKSNVISNDGFAITTNSLTAVIKEASYATHKVSTGACVSS
jgi:S1-C subfamily serine protease